MNKKNSFIKFLVVFGIIFAAAVAVAAVISSMQKKLACSCSDEKDDEDEGCTGNCGDCSFCEPDGEEECGEGEEEETEIVSDTDKVEE
ncbi:MAG: hypothetical protein E7634_08190 [Ruminococcaceae bacterium]|nr:hypothetical protein [Oscillospiraceae bacterium]